ncbi:MAG: substrate-binding domain-containing protein [Microbacteriaceae bacterium]|nr:substrate-binding domain-containing protein [Microbacteriaceae bacterium]MCL2794229.1 substrate-binding domain-containing protein [Microbacteriaceae bacterium]
MTFPRFPRPRRIAVGLAATLAAAALVLSGAAPASAASYVRISGEGSSWAGNAWADFTANAQRQGVTVDYNPVGSSTGRDDFARQTNASFADSEIPFTGDASDPSDSVTPNFTYGMLPVVAGGTAFMYNLPIGGQQYSGLKLNMATIAGIFSGKITQWNDPAIAKTNPGVALPAHVIDVVVRSDGSGATAQFKLWMLRQFPADYTYLAQHTGGSTSHASSYFPTGSLTNFIAQNGSTGVTTYTQNTPYTLDYDEYSYALQAGLPVAKVENAAGFFTTPTQYAVAVALIAAKIDTNPKDPNYLSQDLSAVYSYGDPRSYPMSMYSYEVVPDQTNLVTSTSKGASLAWVSTQAICRWQADMGPLGYSPLPMNLVLAGMQQILKIPGIDAATTASIHAAQTGVLSAGTNPCDNPTFQPGDDPSHNLLVDTAAFPAGCNAACQAPWKQAGKGVGSGPSFGTTTVKSAVSQNPGSATGSSTTGTATGTKTGVATTSTGTAGGTGPGAGVGADSGTGAGGQSCNADTGVCTGSSGGAANTAANLQMVPTTISSPGGWGTTQWLGLAVGLLMFLALIAGPPIVVFARRRGAGR